MKKLINGIAVAAFISMLSACGGGGGSSTPDSQPTIPTVTSPLTGKTGKAAIAVNIVSTNDNAPSGNVIAIGDNIKLVQRIDFLSAQNTYTLQGYIVRDNGSSYQYETGGILLFTHVGSGQADSGNNGLNIIATDSITMVRSGEKDITNGSSIMSIAALDLSKTISAHLANGSVEPAAPIAVVLKACISETDTQTGKPICSYTNTGFFFL